MKELGYWSELRDSLSTIGIESGDIVYVSSDVTGLILQAKRELGLKGREGQTLFLDTFIDILKDIVGTEGTLLFPVYNWDFCKGIPFDIRTTQGRVGSLNNYILNNRDDFIRTKHPLYSLMVWGRYADELVAMDNQDSWGSGSPFAFLHKNGGKELSINVDANKGMTFKHYVEQSVAVPYRYQKFFMGEYTDIDGNTETRVYSMYVRRLEVALEPSQTTSFFVEGGCARRTDFRGMELSSIELKDAYELLRQDLLCNGGHNVYAFTDYEIDWSSSHDDSYEIAYDRNRPLMNRN